jgi:hypothetical protein
MLNVAVEKQRNASCSGVKEVMQIVAVTERSNYNWFNIVVTSFWYVPLQIIVLCLSDTTICIPLFCAITMT